MNLLDYFINWAENGVSWSINEGTYPQEEVTRMENEFKEMREQLEKKFKETEEINDIFNSIIQAAKILKTLQYYELEITDLENEDKYMVFLVNAETIEKLKELKLVHGS